MSPGRHPTRSAIFLTLSATALGLSLSCGGSGTTGSVEAQRSLEPDPEGSATLALSVDVPFAVFEIPDHSRPHSATVPERIPLSAWKAGRQGSQRFVVDNPIRTRNFYFHKPSPGMKLIKVVDGQETEVSHRYYKSKTDTVYWTYDRQSIELFGVSEAPDADEYFFVYPRAQEREEKLNFKTSGVSSAELFARTTAQAASASRAGLLLPAPGVVAWDILVPPKADLRFRPGLIRPEVQDAQGSDGAQVVVRITVDGQTDELWSGKVDRPIFDMTTVDLTAYAGKKARLEVASEELGNPRFDYVFLADPVVATRRNHTRRVFLVFVDTLRPDHMSLYGYARDTTPALEKVAAKGAVFSQARNVAPWTLPSTRSLLTGNDPEYYDTSDTLQGHLRKAGFATAMFAGNIYLGSNFGLNRDWGLHNVDLLPLASNQLDRALAWLDEEDGRDVAMLLHLMDAHLPYKEPAKYRSMYAGKRPAKFKKDSFSRPELMSWGPRAKEDRQYVRDRYDNNIRYIDDQLQRLYSRLRPEDVVVFFSDHGEEFWEHGGFEHGHTLFDELLRVPLIIDAPGIEPSKIDVPVSLLDVTPTVLDLLDLPGGSDLNGTSLVGVMNGEDGAAEALARRPQAFGRPLYGKERWGVLKGTRKWTTIEGKEAYFDLSDDVFEKSNLAGNDGVDTTTMKDALAEAVGQPVVGAYRLAPRGMRNVPKESLTATITVPGGIREIWVGADPTEHSAAELSWERGSDTAEVVWPRPYRGGRDVWIVPKRSQSEVTHDLVIESRYGDQTGTLKVAEGKPASPSGKREILGSVRVGERLLELGFAIGPIQDPEAGQVSGRDDEIAGALKALGYVHDEDE